MQEKKQQQLHDQQQQQVNDELANGPPLVDKKEQEDRDMADLLQSMHFQLHAVR